MAENTVRYNEGWIGRIGEEQGEGMGYLELWVGKDEMRIHETPTGDEVGELNMNGRFAGPSGVKYALGDVLGEDGVLFVRASFWKYQLDAMCKMNPQKGQRYRIAGKFTVETYQRQDGTVGKSIRVNVQKFQRVYSRNEEQNAENGTGTPAPKEKKTTTKKSTAKKSTAKGKAEPVAPEVDIPF